MYAPFAARLSSRGVVQVSGPDALHFLQGLVTNNVHAICGPHSPIASTSAFLNGRGRLLFGTLMLRAQENRYLIDLPNSKLPSLIKHLTQYRLRAKVDITDVSNDHAVWAIVSGSTLPDHLQADISHHGIIFEDPRLGTLGHRAIVDPGFEGSHKLPTADETEFARLRILQGVPDDTDFDNTPLPLDLALHLLNGVSFNKGCYLGQELTARSHFTGVLRKRITPVAVVPDDVNIQDANVQASLPTHLLSSNEALRLHNGCRLMIPGKSKPGGTITSCVDNIGLAVVKLSDTFNGAQSGQLLLEDGRRVIAWRPAWWATDAEMVTSGQ